MPYLCFICIDPEEASIKSGNIAIEEVAPSMIMLDSCERSPGIELNLQSRKTHSAACLPIRVIEGFPIVPITRHIGPGTPTLAEHFP